MPLDPEPEITPMNPPDTAEPPAVPTAAIVLAILPEAERWYSPDGRAKIPEISGHTPLTLVLQ